MPLVLGGDHAVNIPCIRAFSGQPLVHLIQIERIWISSTSATVCARVMATRCAGPPSRPMSRG